MLQEEEVNFDAFVDLVASNERKDAENNANQKGFGFPTCVGVGNKAIVRFVNGVAENALDQGKPGSGRAKLFNIGWVRDDNNKPFLLTLPAILNNKPMYPSIMIDFIDKVLSRTWVENPNAKDGEDKGSWKYFYADRNDFGQQQSGEMTLKQIFWKVFKSGADPNGQFYKTQKSWRGQTVYIANVIDRLDYDWHKQNKKTKLLMRKVTVKDGAARHRELSWYAVGSGLKDLTDSHGTKLNYDVLITPGAEAKDKFFFKNVTKLKQVGYWDEVAKFVTEEDKAKISIENNFTAEELTWDPIDIDKYYHFTSAKTILNHFGKTIKSFDMMVGTNFYEQFEHEAKLEAKVSGKESEAPETSNPVSANTSIPQPAAQPAAPVTAQLNNFEATAPSGAPVDVAPSPEAQNDINTFYASLDED